MWVRAFGPRGGRALGERIEEPHQVVARRFAQMLIRRYTAVTSGLNEVDSLNSIEVVNLCLNIVFIL